MSRRKRSSPILEKAERRMASLKSIDQTLDLGNGLSIESFIKAIEDSRQKLQTYNTVLSKVDQAYSEIQESERNLANISERMLTGIASRYGKNSTEYEMAGGKRRKQRQRKTGVAPAQV